MIYRTAEMQKERDRITDLLKAGRTKEIPTYMDDLKNQIIDHAKPEVRDMILYQVNKQEEIANKHRRTQESIDSESLVTDSVLKSD